MCVDADDAARDAGTDVLNGDGGAVDEHAHDGGLGDYAHAVSVVVMHGVAVSSADTLGDSAYDYRVGGADDGDGDGMGTVMLLRIRMLVLYVWRI